MKTPEQLIRDRQNEWAKLDKLIEKANKNTKALNAAEIQALGDLYRLASSDLALAQRDFSRHKVVNYLNQLVAKAHAIVYQDEPFAWRRVRDYLVFGLPGTFRETSPFFITAMLLFFIPAFITGFLTAADPENARWALPVGVQALIPTIENSELWVDIPVNERPYFSSFIMTNNIRVSFLAFAGGMLAGLFTVYIMIFNGLNVGGLLGLTSYYGVGSDLLNFMIGHGVIELTVIFIAGGSGLMLGWAMVRPGMLSRRDALVIAARKAVKLIVGCVPILVVAGLIEGFISPADGVPWQVKWAVGIGTGLILYTYLIFSGRRYDTN
ncbi:MAG: stage II sporulation protein M [Chloroflexota bacterium]